MPHQQKLFFFSLLALLLICIQSKSNAQSQAWIYADSMMQTSEGEDLYDYYMGLNTDFQDSTDIAAGAYLSSMIKFMSDWYAINEPEDCSPAVTDTTCHNYHWGLSEQIDTILIGWDLFDGVRRVIADCFTDAIGFIPLPENARPTITEAASPGFRFNLNPNDNDFPSVLSPSIRPFSNYHSVELYGDEADLVIPQLISSTPPSGNPSIKLNNLYTQFHVAKMSREFIVEEETPVYYFSYALVMEDPDHGDTLNPFFSVILRDSTCEIIDKLCIIANVENIDIEVTEIPGRAPIVYKQWTCDSFNLKEHIGEKVTIEFIAADCGRGAHFGYAYIADICDDCSSMPHIILNEAGGDTCGIPDLCGLLTFGEEYDLLYIEIEVTKIGNVLVHGGDYNFDPETGRFCFNIDESFFEELDTNCYDLFIVAYFINSFGDTISIRSTSLIPNSVGNVDNDICIPIEPCCPDTLNFIWLADLDNMECIDAGSSGEKIIQMEFVLYLPDDYIDCDNEPIFEDGYFVYDDYTYSSLNNSIHIIGQYHITDISGFDEDYVIRGTIDLCQTGDSTIVCPATFEIAKIDCHSNCSEDPCAGGVECNAYLDVTYVHGGVTYLTFCVFLIEPQGECDYGDYYIYIYDEYGVVLSHSVNPGRVGTNGLYCVEFEYEYETVLEEICLDILIYNYCTDLYFCESKICVENEALWGGGNIESRSSGTWTSNFEIIPNPVSTDQLSIVSENLLIDQARVSLFGPYGPSLVNEHEIELFQGKGFMDISQIPQGYYYMRVTLPNNTEFIQYIPFVIIK